MNQERFNALIEYSTELNYQDIMMVRRLKQDREAAGVSVEQVAQRLELDVEWVKDFESGMNDPTLSEIRLYKLAVFPGGLGQ